MTEDMKKIISDVEVSSNQPQAWCMFDSNEDTCWFSGHGGQQDINIYLKQAVYVQRVRILFQRGFHCTKGKGCMILNNSRDYKEIEFQDGGSTGSLDINQTGDHIKIVLERGADMYGRYCIYKLSFDL
ncbi:uncharacterized protein Eint_080430 [Encephalitozoon intestinalis ATCC 50506]|uniref:Uncharacterized protein n=1 Tax=Encephalitozoon intestinalis (strain ATCC 50506) TaxID=876142 RepID=E0S8I5_ENCIT|nr:uncharacterized protein Eint_080430 [Encephalitozoon intestinalis ATCC 50506]ADM11979.1 hypothetical protein Eint_080430 [Encephalitozoon intestinalis ATCC 50506]UTX45765.1 glucanase [Encephalitozoon intestinalis]